MTTLFNEMREREEANRFSTFIDWMSVIGAAVVGVAIVFLIMSHYIY